MAQNVLQEAADRLGFLAYLTVMGGGIPDMELFLGGTQRDEDLQTKDVGHALVAYDPLVRTTVPYQPIPQIDRTPTETIAA